MISRLGVIGLALIASMALTINGSSVPLLDQQESSITGDPIPAPKTEPPLAWQIPVTGTLGSFAVSSGSVFLSRHNRGNRDGSSDPATGGVYAYDRRTGELRWSTTEVSSHLSKAIYSDGAVYFASTYPDDPNAEWPLGRVRLYRLDSSTGVIEWTKDVPGDMIRSLRMPDHSTIELESRDTKYKTRPNGPDVDYYAEILEQTSVTSFHTDDGRLIRRINLEDTVVHSNIAYSDDELFAITGGRFSDGESLSDQKQALRVYDLMDGALTKEITLPPDTVDTTGGTYQLALDSSLVYVGTDYRGEGGKYSMVTALDTGTGEVAWLFKTDPSRGLHSHIEVHNNLLVFSVRSAVFGLDATSGAVLWKYETSSDEIMFGTPVVDRNVVYFGESHHVGFREPTPKEGAIVALDATTGAALWRHETDGGVGGPPFIGDESIAFTTYENYGLHLLDWNPVRTGQ